MSGWLDDWQTRSPASTLPAQRTQKVQGPAATGSPKANELASDGEYGIAAGEEGAVTGAAQGQEIRAPAEAT